MAKSLPGAVQVDLLGRKVVCTPAFLFAGGKPVDPLSRDAGVRLGRITKQPDARPVKWRLGIAFAGESKNRGGRMAKSGGLRALGLLLQLLSLRLSRRSTR